MKQNYETIADKVKVLTDVNRLMIIDMLSCGELCACEILEKLNITQPTLSHHMKTLCESTLVECRREGKNIFYRLNHDEVRSMEGFLQNLFKDTTDCICK